MKLKEIIGATILVLTVSIAPEIARSRQQCRVDSRTGGLICQNDRNYNRNRDRIEQRNRRYNDRDRIEQRNRRYNSRQGEIEMRIDRLYWEVLGRNADTNGLNNYTRKMRNGWSDNKVRRELARSSEARDKIDRLHREILGRNARSDDLRAYQANLANGWSLDEVREDLINNPEFRRDRRMRDRR